MLVETLLLVTLSFLALSEVSSQTLEPASDCTTLPIRCCATVTPVTNPTVAEVLKGLGITPMDPTKDAGLSCTDVTGTIGPGGNATCATNSPLANNEAVCCGQQDANNSGIDVDCAFVDLSS